jgi:hypothetical protein
MGPRRAPIRHARRPCRDRRRIVASWSSPSGRAWAAIEQQVRRGGLGNDLTAERRVRRWDGRRCHGIAAAADHLVLGRLADRVARPPQLADLRRYTGKAAHGEVVRWTGIGPHARRDGPGYGLAQRAIDAAATGAGHQDADNHSGHSSHDLVPSNARTRAPKEHGRGDPATRSGHGCPGFAFVMCGPCVAHQRFRARRRRSRAGGRCPSRHPGP